VLAGAWTSSRAYRDVRSTPACCNLSDAHSATPERWFAIEFINPDEKFRAMSP
jgi:hypothetical protein